MSDWIRETAAIGKRALRCAAILSSVGLIGCASGNVASIVVTPAPISLNAGQVAQITASTQDAKGNPETELVSFVSSNPALVTISQDGLGSALVCGGVWDATHGVCKGTDGEGNPLSGMATISASVGGTSSSPVSVFVHPTATSVTVNSVSGCTSTTQTQTFTAHAFSNTTDITSQVGFFTWQTANPAVATIDATGVATAKNPGVTQVYAGVSGLISAGVGFRTCLPIEIRLHLASDTGKSLTMSASMTLHQTLTLQADMTDELGNVQNSFSALGILATNPVVASISGSKLTAESLGGAGAFAACTPPACGSGLNTPIYSNLFLVSVPGSSPATTVFAASSMAPPSGTNSTLLPIDTGTNTAGKAIDLPGTPNSLFFSADGSIAYLGTAAGLATLDPTGSTVKVVAAAVLGKVLAVSADGNSAIVSNAGIQPDHNLQEFFIFNDTTGDFQTVFAPGTVAAAFDTDGVRAFVVDNRGNIYIVSPASPPLLPPETVTIGGISTAVASLASDPFIYVANSAGLEVMDTCANVQQPIVNNPVVHGTAQLVEAAPGADTIVVADSTGVDFDAAAVSSILSTPDLTLPTVVSPANCQPNVAYQNQFVDFGVGQFTAEQLLVSSDGLHALVIPAGRGNVLLAAAASADVIPLTVGATQAFSGGMTLDGKSAWVGVGGTNTVDKIDLVGGTDAIQVATSFKKSDGTAAPPDLVAIRPQ